jgi:hypothetical protein
MKRSMLSNLLEMSIVIAFAAMMCSGQEKPKNPLVGSWLCEAEGTRVLIRDNGTLTINGADYIYKVSGSNITVMSDEGSAVMPFSLDADILTVEFEGREIVYTRVRAGSKNTGIGAPSRAEGIIPEFVGKWCYQANLTGTNSYISSKCFVLYANGTYEYSAESSSSGTNGGTNGQSYDSGRWTATRNSLTSISNTNGRTTYPIELRNHPKNGDPMIVVDGDAYVTTTQRRPW